MKSDKHPLLISKGHKPRKGKVINCPTCGIEFYLGLYRMRQKGRISYCNRECASKGLLTNEVQTCAICLGSFYCSRSQLKYRNRKTCSLECRAKFQTQKAQEVARLNPPTVGVLNRRIRYSKRMSEWRKAVFERDNYTCQSCKAKGGYLEADHIKQFAYFPGLRFDLNNGRTLCKDCHKKTPTYAKKAQIS